MTSRRQSWVSKNLEFLLFICSLHIKLKINAMKTFFAALIITLITIPAVTAQQHYTKQTPLPCLNKEFSVVVHMVRDTFGDIGVTEAEVQIAIDSLNYYFEPICASFKICEFRVIDNYQYSIPLNMNEWEEMQVKYHQNNRINLFLVNLVTWSEDICGFATYEGIGEMESGGILLNKFCSLSSYKGLPHLMGHYFGLYHTSNNPGTELVNGSNCETAGDEICDTPADPYVPTEDLLDYIDPTNCRFIFPGGDPNGEFYLTHTSNIMSFFPQSCQCGFTHGQFKRMAEFYLNTEFKMW